MENELPKRKQIRLVGYDYSSAGAYFVTICTQDRKQILSEIIVQNNNSTVGEGLDPPAYNHISGTTMAGAASYSPTSFGNLQSHYKYPKISLTEIGTIAVEQLFALKNRFPSVEIKEYVIMPDHIHAIIVLRNNTNESPVSLFDVMKAYKSLTSRCCKQLYGIERLFQRSFIDHIIRDKDDYETKRRYIYENPIRWHHNHNQKSKLLD